MLLAMVRSVLCIILLCFFGISCTRSVFKGEYNSLLTSADSKKIVVVDFTGTELSAVYERFKNISGTDLSLVHIYCINPVVTEISKECIVECGKQFNSDLAVVCRTHTLDKGNPFEYRPDYTVRNDDYGVVRPSESMTHHGSVFFDVYDTSNGERISEFGVSVRISGVIIKDRKGMGYSNINVAKAQASITKAKRKGLKNILKRLISNSKS